MEYMTVLKRPENNFVDTMKKGIDFEIGQNSLKARIACRRLCSQALFVVVMLFLMFVLFASQLIVHVQMQELRKQTLENEDKMNDILEAALLQKRQMDHHLARLEHKFRHYGRRRRNHQTPQYAILRGGGHRNYGNGIFNWSTNEDNRTILISPDMRSSISQEKIGIPVSGLYSISVRIKVMGRRGRRSTFPPVGMAICKEVAYGDGTTREDVIEQVFLTQDDGGVIRSVHGGLQENPPVDSLTYSNMVYLRNNEKIYVRVPQTQLNDLSIQYKNDAENSHFSIYLLLQD